MNSNVKLLVVIVLVATGALVASRFKPAEASPKWEVEGHYSEACNCEVICPCVLGNRPTYGTCDTTMVFHIDKGRYQGVVLDGLYGITFSNVRYYLDNRANQDQQRALEEIIPKLAVGVYQRPLGQLAADDPVKVVPIQATMSLDRVEATIPGVLELRAQRLTEPGGDQPWEILGRAVNNEWMPRKWAGKSEIYKYSDGERQWNLAGRSAQFGSFKANSDMF
jgi:hypothetical protein